MCRRDRYWVTSKNRRFTIPEMMRLQGMNPSKFYVDVTKRDLGEQIGNAVSVNVIERVLLRALQALHMIANSVVDRWKSGEALQEIRLTKGKFMKRLNENLSVRFPQGNTLELILVSIRDDLGSWIQVLL